MTDFLGGSYVRRSRLGGCGVRSNRTRYLDSTINQKVNPAAEDPQRFDLVLVLWGDEGLRRRFWAHRAVFDVTTPFALAVPQDPDIALPRGDDGHAELTSGATAGIKRLNIVSRTGAAWMVGQGTYFTLAGSNRLYMAASADKSVPATGHAQLDIFPALDAAAARGALLDFKPSIMVTHLPEGGFGEVAYPEQGRVLIRFVVANYLR